MLISFTCSRLTDAGRRYETPGSETKDYHSQPGKYHELHISITFPAHPRGSSAESQVTLVQAEGYPQPSERNSKLNKSKYGLSLLDLDPNEKSSL